MIDESLKQQIKWLDINSNIAIKSIDNIETYINYNYKDKLSMKDNNIYLNNEIIDINLIVAKINEEISNNLNIKGQKSNIKLVIKAIASKNIIVENNNEGGSPISEKYIDEFNTIQKNIDNKDNSLTDILDIIDKIPDNDWDLYKKWKKEECMYIRNKDGVITGVDMCYNNIINWLNNFPLTKNKIRYNKTRMEYYIGNKQVNDMILHEIMQWINKYLSKDFSNLKSLKDAITGCCVQHKYNELYDYFESIVIDNDDDDTDYIDKVIKEVLKCRDIDKYYDYYYYAFKISLVALMKRTYEKEINNSCVKFDNILTLCSKAQGSGKTTFFEKLLDINNNGQSLCYVVAGADFNPTNKDFIIQTHKYAMVCLDEIDMKRGLVNSVKGYITKQSDEVRQPYAYFSENQIRPFTLTATSNNDDFLKDYTTDIERRWMPIPITEDKTNAENVVKAFKEGLRDKIWKQIKKIYLEEPDIKLWIYDDELLNMLKIIQNEYKFYQTDDDYNTIVELLNGYYCKHKDGDMFDELSAREIVSQFNYGDSIKWAIKMNEQYSQKKSKEGYIMSIEDREYDINDTTLSNIKVSTLNEIIDLMKLGCTPQGLKNRLLGTWEKKNIRRGDKVSGYWVKI